MKTGAHNPDEEHFNFHLQDEHYSRTFANRKYEELSYPRKSEMCDPILVNPVVKMRPLLASYKEVPPGIIFSTKEKCLDDLTKCSSRKTSVTGQFIAS